MARASAKRGRRARSTARPVAKPAAKAEAPTVAEPEPPPALEPKPAKGPKPAKEPRAEPRAQSTRRQPVRPEDGMFFTRLRAHAKWVFVLLAVVFAVGFVAFGVGAGGTGFGDAIGDFFGGGSDTPSIEEAKEKVDANPNDADALLALALAYQSQRQFGEATETLERYTKLRPDDVDGLRQLAGAYQSQIQGLAESPAPVGTAAAAFGGTVFAVADDIGFVNALGNDPVAEALRNAAQQEVADLSEEALALYQQQADAYDRITKLTPEDADAFLQLGESARFANENDRAIAAYERFLELDPNNPLAPSVKEQIEQLEGLSDTVTG
jgi:hypothetical protein